MEEGGQKKGWLIWVLIVPVCMAGGALVTRWALQPAGKAAAPAAESSPSARPAAAQDEPAPANPLPKEEIPGDEPQGDAAISWGNNPAAAPQAAVKNDAAAPADPQQAKKDTNMGMAYGALTKAAGALMNSPKAMGALFNNEYVVKGFMSRDTVKNATANKTALADYLKNPANLSRFMAKAPVQEGLNRPDLVNAVAGSKLIGTMLDTPGGKALLQDPPALAEVIKANPDLGRVLANPNIISALMSNPRTAGVVGQIDMSGGGNFRK